MFSVSQRNRGYSEGHARKLAVSMKEYGWIPAFPMLVVRTAKGLEIVDGQHRYAVAQLLGIAVWFVELAGNFDVAQINAPQIPWSIRDYTKFYSDQGSEQYVAAVEFAEAHSLCTGTAAALLCGTAAFTNVKRAWFAGSYKITERRYAESVARVYDALRNIARDAVNRSLLYAIMGAARLSAFDPDRLIRKAMQCPEKLKKFGTRDGALRMLEDIYNHGRGDKIPIHCDATAILAERNRNQNGKPANR
jgi:hypothetical protein